MSEEDCFDSSALFPACCNFSLFVGKDCCDCFCVSTTLDTGPRSSGSLDRDVLERECSGDASVSKPDAGRFLLTPRVLVDALAEACPGEGLLGIACFEGVLEDVLEGGCCVGTGFCCDFDGLVEVVGEIIGAFSLRVGDLTEASVGLGFSIDLADSFGDAERLCLV